MGCVLSAPADAAEKLNKIKGGAESVGGCVSGNELDDKTYGKLEERAERC